METSAGTDRQSRLRALHRRWRATGAGGRRIPGGRGHTVTVVTSTPPPSRTCTPGWRRASSHEVLNGVRVHRWRRVGRSARALRWWLRQRGGWRSTRLLLGEDPGWFLGPFRRRMLAPLLFTRQMWWFPPTGISLQPCGAMRRPCQGLPVVGLPLFHIARPWADRPAIARCSEDAHGHRVDRGRGRVCPGPGALR